MQYRTFRREVFYKCGNGFMYKTKGAVDTVPSDAETHLLLEENGEERVDPKSCHKQDSGEYDQKE